MDRRLFVSSGCAALVLAGAAGSAQATLFSFASDMNSNAYTFGGSAGGGGSDGKFTITDFSRPNTFSLHVDDDNGPMNTVMIPVEFRAALSADNGISTQIFGTLYQHTYRVSGTFGFYDAGGNALLTVIIGSANPAILTVPGSQTAWASSGAVLGADSFADITYVATSALVTALGGTATAAQYGIVVGPDGTGSSVGPDDFGFDLSALNAGAMGLSVAIDPVSKAPTTAWRSESSYSGSVSGGIPTPASAALMSIAGLVGCVRSRRRPSC